ncbi:hypothetical protein FRC04_011985 [Tulasnella sp. 424]|nr:hypothetical protein FRC04_011985 [Tulasnella sp. 424]KAG8971315.1 hypothetical protein FRC05_011307 [Tulasnella sp. 425]
MADSGVPQEQLLELLVQMKTLLDASSNSQEGVKQVRDIINTHPQLAYGLIKTMVSLDIVDQQAFEKTLAANLAQQQAARAAEPIPQVSALSYPQTIPAASSYPTQPGGGQAPAPQRSSRFGGPVQPPSQQQPQMSYGAQQGYPSYPADPRRGSGFQNQPGPQSSYGAPAPAPPTLPRNLPPDQGALIQQVLAMTPAQIAALPPEQRDMLLQVRQSVLGSR